MPFEMRVAGIILIVLIPVFCALIISWRLRLTVERGLQWRKQQDEARQEEHAAFLMEQEEISKRGKWQHLLVLLGNVGEDHERYIIATTFLKENKSKLPPLDLKTFRLIRTHFYSDVVADGYRWEVVMKALVEYLPM